LQAMGQRVDAALARARRRAGPPGGGVAVTAHMPSCVAMCVLPTDRSAVGGGNASGSAALAGPRRCDRGSSGCEGSLLPSRPFPIMQAEGGAHGRLHTVAHLSGRARAGARR